MSHGIYQLVAINPQGKEYVIELNNDNKNNRSSLDFIDSGTSRFAKEQDVIDYLVFKQKIPKEELNLKIRYARNKQMRYMPLIYANNEITQVAKNIDDIGKYNNFVYAFLKRIETEMFSNNDFFYFIKSLNERYENEKDSGNYLNNKVMGLLTEYFYTYVKPYNIEADKSEIQYDLLKQFYNYKTLRTLYTYHIEYLNYKQNQINDASKKIK